MTRREFIAGAGVLLAGGLFSRGDAEPLEAFKSSALQPLSSVTVSDDDFSEGETATADIPLEPAAGAKFFKARIEER